MIANPIYLTHLHTIGNYYCGILGNTIYKYILLIKSPLFLDIVHVIL